MKYIVFAIAVIILWQIKKKIFAKIDEDEERALNTPGTANYIRTNFSQVIEYLNSKPGYHVIFERSDMIQIGTSKSDEYYVVHQHSGGLLIAFVRHSNVYKEWKFSRGEDINHILGTVDGAPEYEHLKKVGLLNNGRCPMCGEPIYGNPGRFTSGCDYNAHFQICQNCVNKGRRTSVNPANRQGCIIALLFLPYYLIKGLF